MEAGTIKQNRSVSSSPRTEVAEPNGEMKRWMIPGKGKACTDVCELVSRSRRSARLPNKKRKEKRKKKKLKYTKWLNKHQN